MLYEVITRPQEGRATLHFSPHCLRHTFASQLLADGVSPAYVQEQLGHASIELTVGAYGRWLRKKARAPWTGWTRASYNFV